MMETVRLRRILVTGSRDWADRKKINAEITRFVMENSEVLVDASGLPVTVNHQFVIVHGACPTGADAMANDFAVVNWFEVEPHPADWATYGIRAGRRRNQEMVDAGADICLAFINPCRREGCLVPGPHGSHGATHCALHAQLAGIEVRRFTP